MLLGVTSSDDLVKLAQDEQVVTPAPAAPENDAVPASAAPAPVAVPPRAEVEKKSSPHVAPTVLQPSAQQSPQHGGPFGSRVDASDLGRC